MNPTQKIPSFGNWIASKLQESTAQPDAHLVALKSEMMAFYRQWEGGEGVSGNKERWKHEGWLSGFNSAMEMVDNAISKSATQPPQQPPQHV